MLHVSNNNTGIQSRNHSPEIKKEALTAEHGEGFISDHDLLNEEHSGSKKTRISINLRSMKKNKNQSSEDVNSKYQTKSIKKLLKEYTR